MKNIHDEIMAEIEERYSASSSFTNEHEGIGCIREHYCNLELDLFRFNEISREDSALRHAVDIAVAAIKFAQLVGSKTVNGKYGLDMFPKRSPGELVEL